MIGSLYKGWKQRTDTGRGLASWIRYRYKVLTLYIKLLTYLPDGGASGACSEGHGRPLSMPYDCNSQRTVARHRGIANCLKVSDSNDEGSISTA
jgi:hypothetical protein